MHEKKIPAAFLVTVIKHLELRESISPGSLTVESVLEALSRLYGGFYRKSPAESGSFGFRG
jgi:hypothetical protein